MFTHFLILGLSGKLDRGLDGAPADGIVTRSELVSYVANNTYSYALKRYLGAKQADDMGRMPHQSIGGSTTQSRKAKKTTSTTNTIGMNPVLIPSGEFKMGNRLAPKELAADFSSRKARNPDFENGCPCHRVKLTSDFYLGQQEVTIGQFRKFVLDDDYQTDAERDGKGGSGINSNEQFTQIPKYTWRSTGFAQTDAAPVVNVSWSDARKF